MIDFHFGIDTVNISIMLSGLKRKLEAIQDERKLVTEEGTSSDTVPVTKISDSANQSTSLAFTQYITSQLWGKLHPHQHEAVRFLIDRLTCGGSNGAILADDMGTGKTCIGIITSWILIRSMQCKGLILCPAGLVNNWSAELQRWLPESLGRTAMVLNAVNQSKGTKSLDIQVNRFITSHAVEHPLLVMSYDMFRIYAPALNTVQSLEFVFCDEGHRIKGLDSKISVALNSCAAMRRVVMTGTPVQNNLQELFAIVNFVVPGYLGEDIHAFRARYEVASTAVDEEHRRSLQCELQSKLKTLMLRRTKEQILSKILPRRHIRYIFVDFVDFDYKSGKTSDSEISQLDLYQKCCNDAETIESEFRKTSGRQSTALLPLFMQARLICSNGSPSPTISNTSGRSISVSESAELLLKQSSKLRILQDLLSTILTNQPQEKIIIASSFLSTLDAVKVVTTMHQWPSLRIDGSISTDSRHKILKLFNTNTLTSNNRPLFSILLLATKAGGEGLNLVAANHLVLMDIDWNPAVDAQTMGRIWRPGQVKEVYIYRMIVPNTIEESILQRQLKKVHISILRHNFSSHLCICASLQNDY